MCKMELITMSVLQELIKTKNQLQFDRVERPKIKQWIEKHLE